RYEATKIAAAASSRASTVIAVSRQSAPARSPTRPPQYTADGWPGGGAGWRRDIALAVEVAHDGRAAAVGDAAGELGPAGGAVEMLGDHRPARAAEALADDATGRRRQVDGDGGAGLREPAVDGAAEAAVGVVGGKEIAGETRHAAFVEAQGEGELAGRGVDG